LGYPDQARRIAREAVQVSHDIEHPFSQVHGMTEAGWVYYFCRQGPETQELAEQALKISLRHDFPFWQACAQATLGGGLILQGDHEHGIELVLDARTLFRATGGLVHECFIQSVLAHGYHVSGRYEDAIAELDAALASGTERNELYMHAELLRQRGEALLALSADNADKVETCYAGALQIARDQSALGWELRATISQARLRHKQHRVDEARRTLADVRSRFTEGFDTPDLVEADALLAEWQS
jgi:hypothetical protein